MSKINDAELRRRLELLSNVQPSPQAASRALDRVRQTLADTHRLQARKSIGRIIMNSKWSKLAVAAAVVVAVLIGLQFVGGSTVTSADVIRYILDANTAVLDIIVGEDKEGVPVIHDMIMGSRIRRTLSNITGNPSIIDLQTGRILSLDETKKEAIYVDLKGLPPIPNYLDNLKNVLVMLQDSPHFAMEDLGIQQIDGHEVIGFRAKHPKIDITLWADSKTGLPIRIEQKEGQLNVICKNLQFGVQMDESLFSMDVPEGYKQQQTQIDLLGSTEADFIDGLRILTERYGDGQFPDSVALEDFMKRIPAMQEIDKKSKLSPEEDAVLTSKVQKHILFLRFFQGQGKWYYRGQGVKLGEADKPIFWYRPKDSATYRVIYGDLHVEDVAPEKLPEPLAADDVPAAEVGYTQWPKPDFVGTQEDLWRITASGPILVQSDLTLMKGPQGTSVMPITLPYPTGVLTAVTVGDTPVLFEQAGPGQYKLQLPLDKLQAGQTKVTCQWTLVLTNLELESNDVPLKSLVPVVSYKLSVVLDPDSGWEYVKDPSQSSWTPFSIGNPPKPATEFGTCGLGIRKRP